MAAVQAVGIERVCEMFELKKIPYFAITSGTNIIHSCKDSDNIDEAANELRNFLELMHQSSNAIYTLVLFEQKPATINKKTLSESNFAINFRLNLEGQILHGSSLQSYNNRETIRAEVQDLRSEIAEMKLLLMQSKAEEEEEEEEEEKDNSGLGMIGKIAKEFISSPHGQNMIANFFSNLLTPNGMSKATQLAGIPKKTEASDEEILTSSLQTLFEKGVTVSDIAKLSEMDKTQIDFLLSMLRK